MGLECIQYKLYDTVLQAFYVQITRLQYMRG
jgi:hypothetical protein